MTLRNRLALTLGAVAVLAFLPACGSDKKAETPALYKTGSVDDQAASLAEALGVPVVADTANNPNGEVNYSFALRQLQSRAADLKPSLGKVKQIILGSSWSMTPVGDQFIVTLDVDGNINDMVEYIQKGVTLQPIYQELAAFEARLGVHLVDKVGLTPDTFAPLKAKLERIATDVLFRQDNTFRTLYLMDQTLVAQDGAYVNLQQDSDSLVTSLREIIDARLFATQVLATISSELGLAVSYQNGTFSGVELRQAIENIRVNENTIRLYNRRVGAIILGQRWEEMIGSTPLTLIVKATDIGKDFEAGFRSFQMEPSTPQLDMYLQELTAQLAGKGLSIKVVTDLLATRDNEIKLSAFTKALEQTLDIAAAQRAGLQQIRIVSGADLSFYPVTGALLVSTDKSPATINDFLKLQNAKARYALTANTITNYAKGLNLGLSLGSELEPTAGTGSEIAKLESFEKVGDWILTNLTPTKLAVTPVQSLRIVNNTYYKTSYDFAAKSLVISLVDFNPATINAIFVAPPPPPPPAPTPTPKPAPTPAPHP